MHPLFPHTAILLFLRDEEEETRAKALRSHFGARNSMQLVRTLNRHALRISKQSGLPIFTIQGEQQLGATFGERFANAFESAFQAGYQRVIAIGNDCLALDKKLLHRAAALFTSSNEVILGPAKDGGAYIVGISKKAYHREEFIALPWQTDRVFDALMAYAKQRQVNCGLLPAANDFDDALDFRKVLLQMPATTNIIRLLRNFILQTKLPLASEIILKPIQFSAFHALRAPPSFIASK